MADTLPPLEPHRELTPEFAREGSDVVTDVLWWFKGFVAAHTNSDKVLDFPDMSKLHRLKNRLDRMY